MKTHPILRSPWFLFVFALSAFGAHAAPTDGPIASLSDAALERAFWDCDVLATHQALPLSLGAHCAMLGDELKARRFGGDFADMLAWWQEHKAAEHAARRIDDTGDDAGTDTAATADDPLMAP